MITLTYTPWKPTFADASEPSHVKELTMTIADGATWEEATSEWYNFLRGAGYVIPYDFEADESTIEVERDWAGLTQEELQDLCVKSYSTDNAGETHFNRGYFADVIEAKLKEKNT